MFTVVTDCGDPKPLLNGGVRFLSGSDNEYKSLVQYHCNEPFYTFSAANQGQAHITLNICWILHICWIKLVDSLTACHFAFLLQLISPAVQIASGEQMTTKP